MFYPIFNTLKEMPVWIVLVGVVIMAIGPLAVAWFMGKGGGRNLDDAQGTIVFEVRNTALAMTSVIIGSTIIYGRLFGDAAIRSPRLSPKGISALIGPILYGPANRIDYSIMGTRVGILAVAWVLLTAVTWFLIRDSGPIREAIDAIRDPNRKRGESGSAHFATLREFRRFMKEDKEGLPIVGAFWGAKQNTDSGKRRYMRLDRGTGRLWLSGEDISRGIMTIGGPGSGKSQSVILPSIADHMLNGHSVILVDPQGELTRNTRRFAAVTGHTVIVHDPTSNTDPRYNLANGIENISDARSISDVLVPSQGGDNKFWSDSASMLLSGCLIRFDNLGDIYTAMSDMEFVGERLSEVNDDASRLANSFLASLETDGKIASNVVATLATALTGWADSTARISTADSDFSAEDIVRQPAVVVLACPGRQRAIYAPYLGAVLRKLMLDLDTIGERNRGPLPMPVGVILDEFPTLGKLDSLVADVNLVRKRRISIMIAAQTKGQFHMIYGPDATNALFAGMATQIIFGGADQETADFYSRASGQATELTEEGGFKLLAGPEEEIQKQQKAQKRQRQLLTSDEIQTPARGNATIFTRYVTESYATQLIFWAKLTRMYQREDWKRMMEGLSEEDAFCLQRPLSFAPAPSIEKAASPQPGK